MNIISMHGQTKLVYMGIAYEIIKIEKTSMNGKN